MIRLCTPADVNEICAVINDGAAVYRGIIPADRWHEPYMALDELRAEIDSGITFWGFEQGSLVGVMGIQPVRDVTLIRHAYVRRSHQHQGIGAHLLSHLRTLTATPILIGTWADALWAIRFYERHGFQKVDLAEKNRLLKTYWNVPERQVETSVVLADNRWFNRLPRPPQV